MTATEHSQPWRSPSFSGSIIVLTDPPPVTEAALPALDLSLKSGVVADIALTVDRRISILVLDLEGPTPPGEMLPALQDAIRRQAGECAP